jgi:hypothetical protein
MVWQDIAIAIIDILFSYSLLHQVYHGFKEKTNSITLLTSLITFLGLFFLSFTFITLGFVFSVITSMFAGTMWGILLIQAILFKDNHSK